jgi:predicted nucleic acid-binding Zn ribbon protein
MGHTHCVGCGSELVPESFESEGGECGKCLFKPKTRKKKVVVEAPKIPMIPMGTVHVIEAWPEPTIGGVFSSLEKAAEHLKKNGFTLCTLINCVCYQNRPLQQFDSYHDADGFIKAQISVETIDSPK